MEQDGEWPIPIIATQDVACGVRLWSTAGRKRASVVVKATFYLLRGGPMRLVSPAPILVGEQHHEGSVDRSVLAPSDVAPYLPRAEVIFTGHAYAPTPSPFVPVRLAVVGSRPLVDKTLHVYGERMWLEGEQMTAPVPFTRIPIRYERAYQGPPGFEENPVGMAKAPGLPVHNVIDPGDPEAPAGFGALAPYWPPRRRLLRNLDPSVLQLPRPELPDTFAWSFFHAAPPDQRCSFLEGNEWIVLEGLHPEHPRFESQLPSARARARLYSLESTSHREVQLAADTLWIDGDRSLCCVLFRGNFEVESDAMLEQVQLFAGLELPGRAIPWPGASVSAPPPQPREDSMLQTHGGAMARPGSGVHAAVNPSQLVQGAAIRPPSGQYAAVAQPTVAHQTGANQAVAPMQAHTVPFAQQQHGRMTPQPFPAAGAGTGASQSLLAALAQDSGEAAAQPQAAAQAQQGWNANNPGATLASPSEITAAAKAALRAEVNIVAPPTSDNYVKVDAAWLEEPSSPSTSPKPAPMDRPSEVPSSNLNHTMTQPPSLLRHLLEQNATGPVSVSPPTAPRPADMKPRFDIDDPPTVAPDTGDLARILQQAEQVAESDEKKVAQQVGARPSPAAIRAQKTTIRGLGGLAKIVESEVPPPTARVSASNVMQSEESPTAQLPVPDVLLKLAAQSGTFGSPPSAPGAEVPTAPISAPPVHIGAPAPPPSISENTTTKLPPIPAAHAEEADDGGRPTPVPDGASEAAPPLTALELLGAIEEDDGGRPTLSGMEAPPVSAQKAAPQVHKGEARMDLEQRIREGESLESLDLSDLDLSGFDFSGKKLANTKFDRANLKKCRMRGADLTGASFEGADLGETDLEDAVLERANLVSAKLAGANLRRAFVTDANFTTCDARRVAFDEASGQRTIFSRARLDGASALSVKLDTADFTEAQLDGANFEGSLLPELRAYEVSAEDASFVNCTMQNARFDGAVISRARLDGASAEDSMWDRSVADGVCFERARLTGASFTKASLKGAVLSHCELEEARFNRANLTGAQFVGVDMGRLTLDGADLTGIVTGE